MKKFCFLLGVLLFSVSSVLAQSNITAKYRSQMIPRFLRYVQINSMSSNEAEWMTPGQEKIADLLYEEVKAFGFPTHYSADKYIYVRIPSNLKKQVPSLGISAHYDTTPDTNNEGVQPQVIKNYDGQPIVLKNNQKMDFESDPYLKKMIGKTIVTSDGTTNLGADDKAGVTIVMTLLQTLAENPKIKHGEVQIVLTPNEDVGRSAERLELRYYKPDFAFDFDAGVDGEVIIENFSADRVVITAHGINGHQSFAKTNGYRNSAAPIAYISDAVAKLETLPNYSSGEEGYIEPHHIAYDAKNNTHMIDFRLRYFDKHQGETWLNTIQKSVVEAQLKFDVLIDMEVIKQYDNVANGVRPEIKPLLKAAMNEVGVTPRLIKERGGTTSAMIMAQHGFGGYGVFTGQVNPHGLTEWLSEEDMYKAYQVALSLVKQVTLLPAEPAK